MATALFSDTTYSLRAAVRAKFARARASRDVVFTETQLATIQNKLPLPIQVRYCPALAKKPITKDGDPSTDKKKFDPFLNPSEELLVAEIPVKSPTHNIVLNKYPVIENHFILSTKENKPQTGLLDEDDLFIALACLRAWNQVGTKQPGSENRADHSLFAFFNSGEHSGASQPHRHIQFLPVEDMEDRQRRDGWSLLCNAMQTPAHSSLPLLHCRDLDCVHYAAALDASVNKAVLHQRYLLLLRAALVTMSGGVSLEALDDVHLTEHGHTTFSYNLAMTTDLIAVLPRRSEAAQISGLEDVFVNGTFLAGTMMVKVEEDWHELQQDPNKLQQIVSRIAYGRSESQKL